MKALVIGSEGNIGKPLVKHLIKKGYDVLSVDHRPNWRDGYLMADINNPADLIAAFQWEPDVVFALSAMVSRVTCEQAASLAVATNLTGLQNMIEFTKMVGAKFVYFSTSEVYGPDCEIMDEIETTPVPNNRYGLTKLLGESLVEHDVKYHGLKAVTLRPFMMYDEDEDLGDHRSAMIRFVTNLARGEEIEVHEGSARGWFHVSDAVRAIEASVHHTKEYGVFNIGHPDIVPIADMAEMVRLELDAPKELVKVVPFPGQMTAIKQPNLYRMQNILGVKPKVDLKEGISLVCKKIGPRITS